MFIGRIPGSESPGYHSIAFSIAGLPGQVMFPAYSKMQDDKNALKKAYLKILKYLSLIAIPAASGIAVIACDFVKVVYGDKWLPAVAALQVLCFDGLNRSLIGTTEQLYLAAGKPEVRTTLNLLQLILTSVLVYPLTMKYSILGTGIAAAVPSALMLVLTFNEAGKIIGESLLSAAKTLLPASAGSIIMFSLIIILQKLCCSLPPLLILSSSIALGAVSYLVFLLLTQKEELDEIKRLIAG